MAKRQFNLSEDEIRTFRQRERQTRDTNELRRLQAVRLYGTGMAVTTILMEKAIKHHTKLVADTFESSRCESRWIPGDDEKPAVNLRMTRMNDCG